MPLAHKMFAVPVLHGHINWFYRQCRYAATQITHTQSNQPCMACWKVKRKYMVAMIVWLAQISRHDQTERGKKPKCKSTQKKGTGNQFELEISACQSHWPISMFTWAVRTMSEHHLTRNDTLTYYYSAFGGCWVKSSAQHGRVIEWLDVEPTRKLCLFGVCCWCCAGDLRRRWHPNGVQCTCAWPESDNPANLSLLIAV